LLAPAKKLAALLWLLLRLAAIAAVTAAITTVAAIAAALFAAAAALSVITPTAAIAATFVTAAAILSALGVGWRRHPRCRAQSSKRRNESFFHVEAPCAPCGAPSPFNRDEWRLNGS